MCWVYSPNIQGRHARWLQTIFEYTMIPTVGCLISRDEWQSSLLWRNSVIWMEATNRSESQDRHLLPNWHWDKSPETEMSVMNVITSYHCHSELFARWAKAVIIIKKETKINKCRFVYSKVCRYKNPSLWCTQVHSSSLKFRRITYYIRDSIDQSKTSFLVSSVSLSSCDVSSSIQWLLCCEVSECGNKY